MIYFKIQKKLIYSKKSKKKWYISKIQKKWYIVKSLKIEKCPEKNDHLSDNLAKGTLMYHQKIIYSKNTKKIQKQNKKKKIEKVPWWKPGNRRIGSKNTKKI